MPQRLPFSRRLSVLPQLTQIPIPTNGALPPRLRVSRACQSLRLPTLSTPGTVAEPSTLTAGLTTCDAANFSALHHRPAGPSTSTAPPARTEHTPLSTPR